MSAVEVIGAEVLVERAVVEHVVDVAQEGGGDGADGFLGASARTLIRWNWAWK